MSNSLKIKDIVDGYFSWNEIIDHLNGSGASLLLGENDVFDGSGYKINDGLVPKIGLNMTGLVNQYSYYSLYHEFAHMIDFVDNDSERILKNSFGLSYKTTIDILGEMYEQPKTYNGVLRELRVLSIQSKLMINNFDLDEKVFLDYFVENGLTSLRFMDDFINIPTSDGIGFDDKERLRMDFLKNTFIEYFKILNDDDLLKRIEKVRHIRNIANWNINDILDQAFYNIPVNELSDRVDVFSCWMYLDRPICHSEVLDCINEGQEELVDTESLELGGVKNSSLLREGHIRKIAYFVKNGFNDPISIDLGFPEMNAVNTGHIIDDGNHRLAAAIIRGDKEIKAQIHGSADYIKEFGLYYPNQYLMVAESILNKELREIGFAKSNLDNEEMVVFNQLKSSCAKIISANDFADLIDVDEFMENEGWHPNEIYLQDPDVVFYKISLNGRTLIGISHSGDDHIFANDELKRIINFGKDRVVSNQLLEEDGLAWLLHSRGSVFAVPKNGLELSESDDGCVKVIIGTKGRRYQLIKDGVVVSAMQVVDNVIENRYTSERYRNKGFSNELIKIVVEKYHPQLKHSKIQTEMGKMSSQNTGLKMS